MDAFGHVNNVVFLRYLEEARIDFLFRLERGENGEPSLSEGTVVAHHEIDYVRQLVHRHEPVIVESWVTRIGAAAFTVSYEIKDEADESGAPAEGATAGGQQVYVRASTVVVPYDFRAQRPRRVTSEERGYLERFLDDGQKSKALVA
jgi:acyl-CoA thioester hydrolase